MARTNAYPKVDWLLETASLPRTFASKPADLDSLARVTGVCASTLRGTATWPVEGRKAHVAFGGATINAAHLDFAGLRFCPPCLETKGGFHRNWQLRTYVACHLHGVLLVDGCRRCGRAFGRRSPFPERCLCGHRVGSEDAVAAHPRAVALAGLFARLAMGGNAPAAFAPVTTLDAGLRLSWFFATCGAADSAEGGWRSRGMAKPRVGTVVEMIAYAWGPMANWPVGLHEWLSSHRRDGGGRVGLEAEFGPWMRRLSAALTGEGCELVSAEVRAWLAATWGRGTLKPSSFLYFGPGAGGPLDASAAARLLGVSGPAVGRMLTAGSLSGETLAMGGRQARRIDPRSVEHFMQASKATTGTAEVATELGTSRHWVEAIRRMGLLASTVVLVDGRRSHRFKREDVTAFVTRLAAAASTTAPDGREAVRLSELVGRRQVRLGAVLEGVMAGEVRCWLDPGAAEYPVFGRFLVSLPDVATSLGRTGPSLSVREVARRLHVSARMVPVLLAAGCLEPVESGESGAAPIKRNVLLSSVEAFASRFRLSRELAVVCETSCKRVVAQLTARGVVPAVAPDAARGISAVWHLTDALLLARATDRDGQ
jgi:hypothetical protein